MFLLFATWPKQSLFSKTSYPLWPLAVFSLSKASRPVLSEVYSSLICCLIRFIFPKPFFFSCVQEISVISSCFCLYLLPITLTSSAYSFHPCNFCSLQFSLHLWGLNACIKLNAIHFYALEFQRLYNF